MEKAKQAAAQLEQAAANIDQQLNESVGVDVSASTKPIAMTTVVGSEGGDQNTSNNVWNDDDFKFDDDDDDDDEKEEKGENGQEKCGMDYSCMSFIELRHKCLVP